MTLVVLFNSSVGVLEGMAVMQAITRVISPDNVWPNPPPPPVTAAPVRAPNGLGEKATRAPADASAIGAKEVVVRTHLHAASPSKSVTLSAAASAAATVLRARDSGGGRSGWWWSVPE